MLVFEESGKPEYPEKNLSEQRREPTTNSTHIWRRVRESNLGHIGGRRVLSPLPHSIRFVAAAMWSDLDENLKQLKVKQNLKLNLIQAYV